MANKTSVAQNCPSLNVIGSFFDLSSNSFQDYATTQSNGECYTLTPPYPAQVCFEYMVPFSDTVRATFHMAACGSLSSVGTGTYAAGCSGTASTNATFTGQSTYDANCNLIGNYIAAGYCGGATAGDILTVCFDLNTSSACDPITICPLLFCNTSLCSTTLPIELISFESTCNGKNIILNWTTSTEINNDYFTIEKSMDGVNFSEIATKNGAGNSSEFVEYSLEVENSSFETTYYRLKQTDFNGEYSYSKIISQKCTSTNFDIYPNPAHDKINVKCDFNTATQVKIKITNSLGQLVLEYDIEKPTSSILIDDLTKGLYQIQIISNNQQLFIKKFIKQ